ncbi:segregation/condensation protein A [Oscillochloris sp. ZM17-4]|uniref:segregation and condensation protein A n=1 Tax=Oscillochloris sp. ZM17-4 TaxID=2866714 RepID=UPI001C73A273|nr:segregation/condensation protein A [Oscillochloris sp. ZM17-4]MBX0327936.1 segregation/condensation protein A [Oscillochloris sp. ZM17-4]
MYTITLPTFEGPLDLLLRLIERAELDITTIALARVADQYLAHVRAIDEPDPHALAEFVSLAARLLLIKSRALLPRPAAEGRAGASDADTDAEALTRQLREYQRYKQLAAVLRGWQDEERRTFLRTAPVIVPEAPEQSPLSHTVAELIAAVQRRLQLALPLEDAAAVLSLPPRMTVAQVSAMVRERLARQSWLSFDDLLAEATSRQDVIVVFWAILELLKRRAVVVEQDALFGMISIGRGAALAEATAGEELG